MVTILEALVSEITAAIPRSRPALTRPVSEMNYNARAVRVTGLKQPAKAVAPGLPYRQLLQHAARPGQTTLCSLSMCSSSANLA